MEHTTKRYCSSQLDGAVHQGLARKTPTAAKPVAFIGILARHHTQVHLRDRLQLKPFEEEEFVELETHHYIFYECIVCKLFMFIMNRKQRVTY